jgi:hypothetical protein
MNFKKEYLWVSILTAALFYACRTKPAPPTIIEKTAFYTLNVKKDTLKKITTFNITHIQIAQTKINYQAEERYAKDANFLKIELTDKSNHIIYAFTEHPLYKRFDLFRESGEIESKSISLQQGEAFFRIPYFSDYKSIKITEVVNFKETKQVTINHEK